MGPKQILSLRVRVDLGVMALKGFFMLEFYTQINFDSYMLMM